MNRPIRRRVCLFGTSADPPTGTGGHLGIARYLASMDDFDEVRILPVYTHMFGSKRGRQAPFQNRVEMCQLLVKDIPKVTVSEAERICFENAIIGLEDSEKSSVRIGTADILSMLKKNEPDVDFTLALGTDTFIDLASGKWRRTDEVFELVGQRIVVFRRLLEDGEHIQKDAMLNESIAKRNKDGQSTIQLIQIPTLTDASSSSVRQTSDESILKNLLTADVLEYMKQMKMYAFSDSNVSNEV